MNTIKTLKYNVIDKNQKTTEAQIHLTINEEKEAQMYLVHKALKQQLKNKRVRNANTKTKSEVRGGGKKPWKQKGTGRARAGSNRSPLWRSGGVIFGPKKKIYSSKINKKEKRLAVNTMIFNKLSQTLVTKDLSENLEKPNTKQGLIEIRKLGLNLKKHDHLLIIVNKKNNFFCLSCRNIRQIEIIEVDSLHVLSLLKADKILITYDAIQKLSNNER